MPSVVQINRRFRVPQPLQMNKSFPLYYISTNAYCSYLLKPPFLLAILDVCVPAHVHASVLVHKHAHPCVFEFAQKMHMHCACTCLSNEFMQIKENLFTSVVLEMVHNVKNIIASFFILRMKANSKDR
ncbi:hypothetical protein EUGRSUZ_K01054 [Eucalyptus grandis]|uniref:Uncharacterized protein n=2 Tax=Eucalyptus grandis TaxID=71139 RepID=A0ACC3IST1_EUCGR|nr:hypothetical protein EUGRSUZ_K01054 [Eucalyptus grandis]